jgi:hypothetical protein
VQNFEKRLQQIDMNTSNADVISRPRRHLAAEVAFPSSLTEQKRASKTADDMG